MDASVTVRFPGLQLPTEAGSTQAADLQGSDPSDEVLLEQTSAGSREAFSMLFQRYANILRRVALRVLRDASEADDLVQDIFVLIHRFAKTFDAQRACESKVRVLEWLTNTR